MKYSANSFSTETDKIKQPYIPDPNLIDAVNLAISLERPLLIQGEPGSGKTQLAKDIVFSLYYEKYREQYTKFYKEWFIKSTSRAKDGLYIYDNIARLRDAQLAGAGQLTDVELSKSKDPGTYVKMGPLGEAFQEAGERCVVLVDEIDKADLDFPNDLLLELDESRFFIEELKNKEIRAERKPIIIITSNNEKNLPPAFLRRCIFYYIGFPDLDQLIKILGSHFPQSENGLKKEVAESFLEVRDKLKSASKNVSTSELLNWFNIIKEQRQLYDDFKQKGELPFKSVLLKTMEALEIFRKKQ